MNSAQYLVAPSSAQPQELNFKFTLSLLNSIPVETRSHSEDK